MKAKSIVQKKMRASYIHINRQNSVIDKLTNDLNSPDSPLKLRSLMKSTKSKAKDDISEEYTSIESEEECKTNKIKQKEQFNFGNSSTIVEHNINLDELDRLVVTPKEKIRIHEDAKPSQDSTPQGDATSLRFPNLKQKENKRILDVIKHNEEFRSFITMRKKKFEKMARKIEELSNVKGAKNKIIEYAENHNRIRKLINKTSIK